MSAYQTIACASEEEWKRARLEVVTASEAAAVLGVGRWDSPFSLWASKIRPVDGDADQEADGAPELDQREWLLFGQAMEGGIADYYARKTGLELLDHGRFTIMRSTRWPFLSATIDREIVHPTRGPGDLEIKCSLGFRPREWEGQVPLPVQIQAQTQLAVLDWSWGNFAALTSTGIKIVEFQRDDTFILETLIPACEEFAERLATRDPPPVDGSRWTSAAIKRLHPDDTGATITLPEESSEWAAELEAAALDRKRAELREAEVKNRIEIALGDATWGKVPSGGRWQWKVEARKAQLCKGCGAETRRASSPRVLRWQRK